MGVIDILPSCVSSVYFMWEKEYEKFSLGKVSPTWLVKKDTMSELVTDIFSLVLCAKSRWPRSFTMLASHS